MSNGIDIDLIRDNYSRMGNQELIHIAANDAAGMTPEAQAVIKEELKKRNLDTSLVKSVDAQNKDYVEADYNRFCELIRGLNCPVCGGSEYRLNATMTNRVMSFLIITHRQKKIQIACPNCLDKANNNALITTALLGWWGFPWGLIRTPMAIYDNIKSKQTNHSDQPSKYLKQIAVANAGKLEVYKDNKQKLQEIFAN